MSRVIGYVRESTIDQVHNGFNMDDQVRQIEKYFDLQYEPDHDVLQIVKEEGVSAKSLNRPQIRMILEMVGRREFDILIVYSLDRLTRNVADLNRLLEFFEKRNIKLISITEHIDTNDATGRMLVNLLVLIAQWELDMNESRSTRGVLESAAQGNYAIASVPIGYRRKADNRHKLEIVPEEAEIVSMIYREIAADKESSYTMANKLREAKVLGRSWVESTIDNLVRNKLYMGILDWKGVYIENFCESVVDAALWEKANYVLDHKKYERHIYRYSSLIYCRECETMMYPTCTTKKSTGKTYLYYRCKKCRHTVSEDYIHSQVYVPIQNAVRNDYKKEKLKTINKLKKAEEREIAVTVYMKEAEGLMPDDQAYEKAMIHLKKIEKYNRYIQ